MGEGYAYNNIVIYKTILLCVWILVSTPARDWGNILPTLQARFLLALMCLYNIYGQVNSTHPCERR